MCCIIKRFVAYVNILLKYNVLRLFSSTFVDMKPDNRQHIASWLLLAVFLPMLAFSSLHVHEAGSAAVVSECADCVHHNCQGHLTQVAAWAYDCVLCQFLTLSFLTAAIVAFLFTHKVAIGRIYARRCHVFIAHSGIVGLRAPPAFLHLA